MSTVTDYLPPATAERLYHCRLCCDDVNGWILCQCAGAGEFRNEDVLTRKGFERRPCARVSDHGPHTFADRCTCIPTNPVIQEKRLREEESRIKRQAKQKARRE